MMERLAVELAAVPKLETVRRALFIQPHPDDNEIGAGGTMAYLLSRGAEVFGLTVTDDRLDCPPDQYRDGLSLRQREALDAMARLGVQSAGFLGFADKTDATAEQIA